jgi:putative peptide zinc metalloprotease protein
MTAEPQPQWQGLDEPARVDTSERDPVFLLTGKKGSQIRLSEGAHQLLRLRGAGVTSEEISAALGRKGQTVSAEEIETRYNDLLKRIAAIEERASDNPLGFWVRIRLLPATWVQRIVRYLRSAYRPVPSAVLLTAIAAFFTALFILRPMIDTSSSAFWIGYGLFLVSVLLHELGHASACAAFGVQPSEIGATLYLIYPALYSDVSAAWQLPRRQRVVVDLGGMYFQFLIGAVYLLAYQLSGWAPLKMAVLMILGSGVFSLNPIFKFDGYWVVADSLGVTNLSQQPSRVLRHLWQRLRGRPVEPLPWSPRVSLILSVYSVLSVTVWGWFLWRMGPRVAMILVQLPGQLAALAGGTRGVSLPSLLMSLFMTGLSLFISWRLLRSMILAPAVNVTRRLWSRFKEAS